MSQAAVTVLPGLDLDRLGAWLPSVVPGVGTELSARLIAESRVRLEPLRLRVLKTAWLMDTVGTKGAHSEIQAIKIATPSTVQWILDKAIQVHGAGGLSQDFPLASFDARMRTRRFAGGPDEVHKNALAKAELRRKAERRKAS